MEEHPQRTKNWAFNCANGIADDKQNLSSQELSALLFCTCYLNDNYGSEMTLADIFDCKGDGSQDDGTLYSLSDEFLEAACVLQATPPTRVKFSSATYYLLGHSAELMLKAFLFKKKVPVDELKKIGHDLSKLVSLAKEKGLPKNVHVLQIQTLADNYKNKSFEYRIKKGIEFQNDVNFTQENLTQEIKDLQSAVFEHIMRD